MLTKEYRFSLIFPPLLICSFDLPDSTIQIIRAVPVFHATNVMPKLNQTKVFKERKKKVSALKELFLTPPQQLSVRKAGLPKTNLLSAQHHQHLQKASGGTKCIPAGREAAESELRLNGEQLWFLGRNKTSHCFGALPMLSLGQLTFPCKAK